LPFNVLLRIRPFLGSADLFESFRAKPLNLVANAFFSRSIDFEPVSIHMVGRNIAAETFGQKHFRFISFELPRPYKENPPCRG
jgi:hypothetical protein